MKEENFGLIRLLCGFSIAGSILLHIGCETLTVPPTDSTPPEVSLAVNGLDDPIVLTPGDPDVTESLFSDAEIILLAGATDPDGGIQNVLINGTATAQCIHETLGTELSINYIFIANNPEDAAVGVGDEARAHRGTYLNLKLSDLMDGCPSDYYFNAVHGCFTASAMNFHSGSSTTAQFCFAHSPR